MYYPPEMVIEYASHINSDYWSIGLILIECLIGKAAYKDETMLYTMISNGEVPHIESGDSDLRSLIKNLCSLNPNDRRCFMNKQEYENDPDSSTFMEKEFYEGTYSTKPPVPTEVVDEIDASFKSAEDGYLLILC